MYHTQDTRLDATPGNIMDSYEYAETLVSSAYLDQSRHYNGNLLSQDWAG